ncbi:bridging integrator 3 isoform X7 [Gallus gallus]|uniref:bridging integrator 3 isoform X7 n=1 Tax=Gallus gallus TaxID=9031 RepID=UPI001AEB593D|nr:bridging integrator 3 isoform X7 [Gallus gallus]
MLIESAFSLDCASFSAVVLCHPLPSCSSPWPRAQPGSRSRSGSPRNRLYPRQWRGTSRGSMGSCSSECRPRRLEEQTKKLQKDMKKSTDADLAMSKAAVKISSDLLSNPLCEQDAAFLGVVTAFDTAMRRMDSFNQEKVNQIQKTVIEPLKNTASEVPWSGPAHSPQLLYGRRNAPQCSFPHAKASSCGAVPWGCVMGLCHGAVLWGCAMGLCYGAVP